MGTETGHICRRCHTRFKVHEGGGFFFDELHCDACGASRSVSHRSMGDIHLRYIKGLGMPYAIARAEMDREIQETYPGPALTEREYHAAVEKSLEPCKCGGRFRYDAPARCPTCRLTSQFWDDDPAVGMAFYD